MAPHETAIRMGISDFRVFLVPFIMQIMQFASPPALGPKRKMWEGPLYGHAGAVAQRFPYRFQEVFEDHFSTPG